MTPSLVCSLEVSKKLAEAGIKIESEFWWLTDELDSSWKKVVATTMFLPAISDKGEADNWEHGKVYPAPLTDELLEILPKCLDGDHYLEITVFDNKFRIHYPDTLIESKDKSLPDALGKMAIWLKREGLVG